MTPEDRIRATHGEREAVAEELRSAYAIGCLDNDELEDRVGRAYAAKTRGDLTALVGDLPLAAMPGEAGPGPAALPSAAGWPARARGAAGVAGWLTLAAAGAWVISVAAGGVVAVPLIAGWLGALQLRGAALRRGRQLAAAVLISRFSAIATAPVPGEEV